MHIPIPKDKRRLDIRQLHIPHRQDGPKKYFCPYCLKLQTKFARHLESKHKDEEEVKKFLRYQKKSIQRSRLIERIRKAWNDIHNSDANQVITIQEYLLPADALKQSLQLVIKIICYISCNQCKGLFSKRTLRIHYKKCNSYHVKGVRGPTIVGRAMKGNCHEEAGDVMQFDTELWVIHYFF